MGSTVQGQYGISFKAIGEGIKTFDVRKNDRDFKEGDTLYLHEYNPLDSTYTGNEIVATVNYILPGGQFGIEKDYVVMGITVTERTGIGYKRPDAVAATFVAPEKENPSPAETLKDRVDSLDQKLETLWTEVFSGGVGDISPNNHRFRTTLKGTVDNLCAHANMPPVQSPWSQKKEAE